MTATVVVVGGGIAGLAAAWELTHGKPSFRVVLVERESRVGGKITTAPFAGIDLDGGPDSFLARVPAAATLAREAGLGDELVAPATGQALLWARGRLRALPTGLVLGLPADVPALARSGVLPRWAAARAALDLVLPGRQVGEGDDVSVGAVVRRRMGATVQMGLVDPLLGGINAGHTDDLSAAVAAPQILAAARRDRSLIRGLRAAGTSGTASGAVTGGGPGEKRAGADLPRPVTGGGPGETGAGADLPHLVTGGGPGETGAGAVFLTVRGGLGRLVAALAAGIGAAGGEVLTGDGVAAMTRDGPQWSVTLESGRTIGAAAVVVAAPTGAAARLLEPLSPAASMTLGSIRTASVALVLLSYAASATVSPLAGSGFLVPRGEGKLLTACSWVGAKWPHLAQPDRLVVRASTGRIDDDRQAHLDDYELINRVHAELAEAMGLRGRPLDGRVHRWVDAFPQFEVGHLERISRAEERLAVDAPGVFLAGAALRGVGLATCIAGGRAAGTAARRYVTGLTTPA